MGSEMRQISVVVPVRNDALLLGGCLAALAAQRQLPNEIIIVDNASTDDLAAVLAAHPDLPIRVVGESRPGIPFAVAAGYDAAGGEVILRCDADSRPPPDWIARHVRTLARSAAEVVGVSGMARSGYRDNAAGRITGLIYLLVYRGCAMVALGHHALWGSNMAIRASWWREIRNRVHLRRDVHDDFDLSFQLRAHEMLVVDPHSVMPVSWRAVVSPRRIWRQACWAVTTVRVNWASQPHWERLAERRIVGRLRGSRWARRKLSGKPPTFALRGDE